MTDESYKFWNTILMDYGFMPLSRYTPKHKKYEVVGFIFNELKKKIKGTK